MREIEIEFAKDVVNMIENLQDRINYTPTFLIKLIDQKGAVAAAKQLVVKPNTYGFNKLKDNNLLNYSLEAIVLKPQYANIFSETEKECCRSSLSQFGYNLQQNKNHSSVYSETAQHISANDFRIRCEKLHVFILEKARKFDKELDFISAVDVLLLNGIIDEKTKADLNYVRINRNRVVHSTDLNSQKIDEVLIKILENLESSIYT